jgi:hypothetical protein
MPSKHDVAIAGANSAGGRLESNAPAAANPVGSAPKDNMVRATS